MSDLYFTPSELIPYINWIYFFHAWGIKNYTHDAAAMAEAVKVKAEAIEVINHWDKEGYKTRFRCNIYNANSQGEDIILGSNGSNYFPPYKGGLGRVFCLRQQQPPYLCLADFLPPRGMNPEKLGLFASTVPIPAGDLLEQTVADRLAEATAELGHLHVRRDKDIWGFSADEDLRPEELFKEKYQGKRPAVGYPSLPDQSIIFEFAKLLDYPTLGITVTESGAMIPHASTTGLIIANPNACHFSVGTIGQDQLEDYAKRREMKTEVLRHFLASNVPPTHHVDDSSPRS